MFTQLTFEARGRFPWQAQTDDVVAFARTIGRVAGAEAVLFGFAGDHGHVVVETPDARSLGYLRSKLRRAAPFANVAAEYVHASAVEDRGHLAVLAAYMGRQPLHHGLPCDPALFLGTSTPDILGARILAGFRAGAAAAALPLVDVKETVLRAIGLRGPLCPASDAEVRELGAVAAWRACVDALALPSGDRLSDLATTGRRAWCELATSAGFAPGDAREVAEISKSAWHRLRALGADPVVVEAARLRVGLIRLAAATPIFARKVADRTPPPVMLPRRPR